MKAVQITGYPGEWSCLVASPKGRAMKKGEIRVLSYFSPCLVVGDPLTATAEKTAAYHDTAGGQNWAPTHWAILKRLMLMVVVMAAAAVTPTNAATMAVSPIQSNTNEYVLDLSFTNNDNGVVYNSASTNVFTSLAQDIYALGNSTSSSVSEMVNDEWGIQIRNLGEVDNGWSAQTVGLGAVDFTNNGLIPNVTYDTWQNTATNSNQDTMALRITVPNYLLDTDGTAGYNPLTDHTIGINPIDQPNMFTGTNGPSYSTAGPEYQLNTVPEPTRGVYILIGILWGLGYRKRKNRE